MVVSLILSSTIAWARPPIPGRKAQVPPISLLVWQPSNAHPTFILPQRKGETAEIAIEQYLDHVGNDLDISAVGPGPQWLANAPVEAWKIQDRTSIPQASVLLIANRRRDHLPNDPRIIEMSRPYLNRDVQPFVFPVGAGLRLSRSERKAFHRQIAFAFSGLNPLGGADLAPRIYRRVSTFARYYNELLDRLEIELVKDYIAEDLGFVLAICRGAQLLNVAFGGKMIQGIPEELNSPVIHGTGEAGQSNIGHTIRLLPTVFNILAAALKVVDLSRATNIEVNSYHHQAMQVRPGGRVRVAAVSEDGVPEAIEVGDKALGVQSHPERSERPGVSTFGDAIFDFVAERIKALSGKKGSCETLIRESELEAILGPQAAS